MKRFSLSLGLFLLISGFQLTASANIIGDFVWEDLNTNGIQNVGEPGVSNVFVTLYDADTNFIEATLTDVSGFYGFTNQSNNTYFVGFVPPNGFTFTTNDVGDDNFDSDVFNAFGFTHTFVYTGVAITNIDAGLFRWQPAVAITKTAGNAPDGSPLYVTNGAEVTYTYVITNIGNTHLSQVQVTDDVLLSFLGEVVCPANLPPGGSVIFTATTIISASVTNIGTVTAVPVDPKTCNSLPGVNPVSDDDDAVVLLVTPGYTLTKEVTSPVGRAAAVGENILFTITIVNTGDVDLAIVPVEDIYDTTKLDYVSSVPASDNNTDDGTINWANIGPLTVGSTTSIVATFTARASTPLGATNTVITTPQTPTNFPPVDPQTNEVPYDISNPGFTVTKSLTSPSGRAAAIGESIVFTITVVNTGDVELVTVPVVDTYNTAFISYVSATPASDDNANDGTINWANIGPLPVGASTSIVATFTAVASTVGDETNRVVASPTTPQDEPPVPPKTNEVPYDISSPGFTVTKTVTSPSGRAAAIGESIVFTITVVNTGDVTLVTVPVVDTYNTAFISYVSSVPASDNNANDGTINWANIGPLPAGASTSIVATFTAVASTVGDETNRVVASPTTPPDEPPVPPRTNEVPYDISNPGFSVTKTVTSPSGRAAAIGESIIFTITVVNTGDVTLVTVPVVDTYNTAFISYVSSVPASDNNVNDGTINWANIGPLPAGASTSIVATFTAVASTVGDETNRVVASPTTPPDEPPVPPKTNEVPFDISSPGYTVTKTVTSPSGRAAAIGESIVFTITVVNTGDVALVTVPVVDTYSTAYIAYVSATPASDDNVNDGTINWANIGPLPAGASTSIVATFTAVASTVGDETNRVVASPTTPPDEPPVPPKTNEVPYDVSNPGFTVSKTVTSPSGRAAAVGESIIFTITVVNTGDVTLVTVPVVDTYNTAFISYVSSVPASVNNANDGTINWANVGPLPAGASTSIVATFTAVASTVGDETNRVVASPTTPPDEPPVPPKTNEVPYDISNPGFTVTKTVTSPSGRAAAIGESIVFTITVVNTGDVALVTVPVVDTYSTAFISYVSATPASDDNVNDGTINWANIGPLPAGASTSIVATFTAVASTVGDETNRVVASPTTPPDEPPVPPKTNEVPYDVSNPGFTVTKTLTSPAGRAAAVGESIIFTITVVNTGDVTLVTVPVVDTYNTAFISFVSAVPASVNNVNDGTINWANIGPLPVGASTSIVATFTAIAATVGDQTNRVVASPTTPPDEPPVPPKTNEVPFDISQPGYTLAKTLVSPTGRPAVVGEQVVFNLTVVNTGDVTLVTVPLQDIYNTAFLTFVSATPASVDNVNDGSINWANVGPLPPGISTTVVVRFTAAGVTSGQSQTNRVIASPTTPPDEPPVPPKTNDVPYSVMTLTIGDTTWLDLDGDGSPDENLAVQGLNQVRVDLYNVVGGVTNFVDFRITTNGPGQRGYYIFTNLPFGSYFAQVDLSSIPAATPTNFGLPVVPLIPTTPTRINIPITTNGVFLNADFGFISANPTAVELTEFRSEVTGNRVRLIWETATELNNMGFNLYRASSPDGVRVQINTDLVPGRGTGLGGDYSYDDPDQLSDGNYYYWLEDVEYDSSTREHGPLRVEIGNVQSYTALGSASVSQDGLVMLSAGTFDRSGISIATLDPAKVRVYADGEEVATFVSSYGSMFAEYDFILAYVESSDGDAPVTIDVSTGGEGEPMRMAMRYVFLSSDEGDVWTSSANEESDIARFAVDQAYVRYLVTGFSDSSIWLLDISQVNNPALLIGADIVSIEGKSALYFSDSESTERILYAIGASGVREIEKLDSAE